MKPSDLFRFTARCLSMEVNPAAREEVLAAISAGKVTWENFVWIASSHYSLPAAFAIFRRNGILPHLPADLTEYMERIFRLNETRNLQILDQCGQINTLLRHYGVEPLYFKGAGLLLSGLFRDPAERMMEDIDILIRPEDGEKASAALSSGGYRMHEGFGEKVYAEHHHLPPLFHSKNPAAVEFHLMPFHRNYISPAKPDEIFLRSVMTGNGNFRVPSTADSILICFAHEHRAARGYLSRIASLKGMYDFILLSEGQPAETGNIMNSRFGKEYLRFEFLTRRIFGMGDDVRGIPPETQDRWWKRERFLMDHPVWDRLWNRSIYAGLSKISSILRGLH